MLCDTVMTCPSWKGCTWSSWCVSIASWDCFGFGWLLRVVSVLFFLDFTWLLVWSVVYFDVWCLEVWLCLFRLIRGLIARSSVSSEVLEGCLRSCCGRGVGTTPLFVMKPVAQLSVPKVGRMGPCAFFLCCCWFAAPGVRCVSNTVSFAGFRGVSFMGLKHCPACCFPRRMVVDRVVHVALAVQSNSWCRSGAYAESVLVRSGADMPPIEVPESGNIVVGNRLGNGKEKGAAREKSQGAKGKGWQAPEWNGDDGWGVQNHSRPPPPPMKGGKGQSSKAAYYDDQMWGHGNHSWSDYHQANQWEDWHSDGGHHGGKGKPGSAPSGIQNLKQIVHTIMHEGDGKGKAKGYGNPAQYLTPKKNGLDDGSDYGKGGTSTPSTTWSSPGSEKGQEWGKQWLPEQRPDGDWHRYSGGKGWKGDQKGGEQHNQQQLFQEWVQSKTALKGGEDAAQTQGPEAQHQPQNPVWDEWDETEGRKGDQGAGPNEKPGVSQTWTRRGAREAARGVPRWYFPASSMRREGNITGIGAPNQVPGTAQFDWGGIHLGGRHYAQILSCAQEKGATCRVICVAVDPVEAELLAKGHQEGVPKGFCVVVAGDQKDRIRMTEIVSRIEWRIEKSEVWDRLDFILQEFAAQQGLRTKSSRTELMQWCVDDDGGHCRGTESTPMQNGQPVHTAELEKYIQDRIAMAFQQQSGGFHGQAPVPGQGAPTPQGHGAGIQVCERARPVQIWPTDSDMICFQVQGVNGQGDASHLQSVGTANWGQQWITPTPHVNPQGVPSMYTPTYNQSSMHQQTSLATPTYPNQPSWPQSGGYDASGGHPQGYVHQIPQQGRSGGPQNEDGFDLGVSGLQQQMSTVAPGGGGPVVPIPGQGLGHHGQMDGAGILGPNNQGGTPPAPNAQQGQAECHATGYVAQTGVCRLVAGYGVSVDNKSMSRRCVVHPGKGSSDGVRQGCVAEVQRADAPVPNHGVGLGSEAQLMPGVAPSDGQVDQHGFPVPHHAIGVDGNGTVLQQPNLRNVHNANGGGPCHGGASAVKRDNVGGLHSRGMYLDCAQVNKEGKQVLRVDISSDDTVEMQGGGGACDVPDVDMDPDVGSRPLKPAEITDAQRASWGGAKRQRVLKPSGRLDGETIHRSRSPPRGKTPNEGVKAGTSSAVLCVHRGVLSGVYDSFDSSAPMLSCFQSQEFLDDSGRSLGEQFDNPSQTQAQFLGEGDSCDSLLGGAATESQVNCLMESCPPGGAAS